LRVAEGRSVVLVDV